MIEAQKSLDSVTFYQSSANNTGTVRQVIDVSRDASALPVEAEQLNGLTPPMLDVRNRKWRKRQPRKKEEIEQVALELEALQRGGTLKPEYELVAEVVVRRVRRGVASGRAPCVWARSVRVGALRACRRAPCA